MWLRLRRHFATRGRVLEVGLLKIETMVAAVPT